MYPDTESKSAKLWSKAQSVMPGGCTRHTIFFPPYPIYAARGQGARVWDVDGVERIDCINNYSSLIHGHGHPDILSAAAKQINQIISVGLPTESEIELAALLCDRIQSVDMVRFTNSGTEATMVALKVARAYTGRPMIAKTEGAFHGSGDDVETSLAPSPDKWGNADAPNSVPNCYGVPEEVTSNTLVLPLNNIEATRDLIRRNAGKLAAVLIDPLVSRLGFVAASGDYLAMVQEETAAADILLIFDEVFSFRLGFNGAQHRVGLSPDLTILGKIIGGGFPVGAVGGRREFMSVLDQTRGAPLVIHGGTFNANPMTMTAGLAAMELLTLSAFRQLAELGDRLRNGLREIMSARGIKAQVMGEESLVAIILSDRKIESYRDLASAQIDGNKLLALQHGLLNRGVLMVSGGGFLLSTVMTMDDIDFIVHAVDETFTDISNQ